MYRQEIWRRASDTTLYLGGTIGRVSETLRARGQGKMWSFSEHAIYRGKLEGASEPTSHVRGNRDSFRNKWASGRRNEEGLSNHAIWMGGKMERVWETGQYISVSETAPHKDRNKDGVSGMFCALMPQYISWAWNVENSPISLCRKDKMRRKVPFVPNHGSCNYVVAFT